jgi:hypothetical protein
MALTEHPSIQGVLTLELRDPDGALLERRCVHNLITNKGKALLAQMLGGKTNGAVQLVIGVGEGNVAAAAGNEALGKKLSEAKAEMSDPVIGADSVKVTVKATVVDGGTVDKPLPLTEAGILVRVGNDAVGVLFNRVTFPVINKGANMSLLLSWDLTF